MQITIVDLWVNRPVTMTFITNHTNSHIHSIPDKKSAHHLFSNKVPNPGVTLLLAISDPTRGRENQIKKIKRTMRNDARAQPPNTSPRPIRPARAILEIPSCIWYYIVP